MVCEPAGLPVLETSRKLKTFRKINENESEATRDNGPGIGTPKERIRANKIVAQVRGYESENENSRDSTTTSGSLMP